MQKLLQSMLSSQLLMTALFLLNDGIDGEKGYRIAFSGDKGIEEKV